MSSFGIHGMSGTPTYISWSAMLQRCGVWKGKPAHSHQSNGYKVCDRWLNFENFFEDMGERPDGTTLDRYPDNTGDYTKENCRWATPTEQQRNMKSNRVLTFGGKTQCLAAWAVEVGCTPEALSSRLKQGWTIERVLTTPPRRGITVFAFGKTAPLSKFIKDSGLPPTTVYQRINAYGWTIERALSEGRTS
jgi:hypothetical protein